MHERGYFRWLKKEFLEDHEGEPDGYSLLIEQMYRKAYYFIVPNDENRAEDGLYLRDQYLSTAGRNNGKVPEGPCSFLEFLIGVSIRLSEMLIDGEPIPVNEYFWELAGRLQLTEFTDDTYSDDSTMFAVDLIMTDYMDRKYCRDGSGGLFPLRRSRRNQTKVEVWYQLNAYLLENPDFFEEA